VAHVFAQNPAWATTFALTVTNPATILSFAAIFAGLGLGGGVGGYGSASLMVVGVFLGSAFWWLLLSTGVGFLRSSITPAHPRWVNRGAPAIITAFGIGALLGLLA
jgi:arginine exporter protein ArgO